MFHGPTQIVKEVYAELEKIGKVRRLLSREPERLELRRVAELVLDELLRRLSLVLESRVTSARTASR
jgi:hypothetical protein